MPFAALAFALCLLAGSADPADAGSSSKPMLASQPPASLLLAVDDEVYGERDDEDEDAYSEDPDFNYGYEDDDEDNSAHGPGDDEDDGWDIDDIVRSERA